ncbi:MULTISPECIES: class IV adenylate cyclase [unclassified Candidatus Nanosynbacter]|jgi:adenylate cyclase, class 2|uniref:class IV adenylate cyclase n=1 Tax=unclassified Candidatus Nanosynbacter TaxID=2725944 RepID=UPI001FB639C6|nr:MULTISPECIES: class IV adenylate cyclase [unclassified Candidatus Nanosynbacter]MCJ1963273.1 class IV adenylate cyclase [Candidatus Nanosynbacter sp. TM7-033]UOG67762.1 class IV adenylate cyclase [Candidatus Nanosynbacter sp. HMT-352]
MIEVESKFKVLSSITRDELLTILKDQFIAPISVKRQIDTVFLLPEQVDAPIVPGSKIMRVRDVLNPETGELQRSLMTLKVEGQAKLVSDEYEFAVDDGNAARQMLTALGWQEIVTVDKVRLESKTEDYTICIDEVAGLGLFIELEILTEDDANVKNIQQQMCNFLKNLNIDGKLWKIPYDTSIRDLQNNVS